MFGWLRRWWWLLAAVAVALGIVLYRFRHGRGSPALERSLRRVWLNARMAEWKINKREAEQILQLQKDVEAEQERAGKKAVVEVERLAKSPSALLDAYRVRLEHLKGLADDSHGT